MKDEAFERTMEAWAEQEQAAAPSMGPTQEMYELVEAKQKRGGLFAAGLPRWARLGATIASVLLVVLAYTQLYQPRRVVGPPVAVVHVREAFPTDKGLLIVRPPTGRRGPPKGQPQFFEALEFQYHSPESAAVTALDLRQPPVEHTVLSADESYRLALQPSRDCYVYVYQSASGGVEQLFPNEAHGGAGNPLREGETYYLPSLPGGFHLDAGAGEQRIDIVAATAPLPEVVQAYESHVQADDDPARRQAAQALLRALDAVEATHPDQAVHWTFDFTVR